MGGIFYGDGGDGIDGFNQSFGDWKDGVEDSAKTKVTVVPLLL